MSRLSNMLVAEIFLISLIKLYGKHVVYSDDAGPWYHEAYNSVGIKYKLHISFEKCIIERAMEYVKNRTEDFDYCP
jgi:transposase-like protein